MLCNFLPLMGGSQVTNGGISDSTAVPRWPPWTPVMRLYLKPSALVVLPNGWRMWGHPGVRWLAWDFWMVWAFKNSFKTSIDYILQYIYMYSYIYIYTNSLYQLKSRRGPSTTIIEVQTFSRVNEQQDPQLLIRQLQQAATLAAVKI